MNPTRLPDPAQLASEPEQADIADALTATSLAIAGEVEGQVLRLMERKFKPMVYSISAALGYLSVGDTANAEKTLGLALLSLGLPIPGRETKPT